MNLIYDVIEIEDPDRRGNKQINQDRIKTAKRKYKLILDRLGRDQAPVGSEERRVAELFGADAKPADFRAAMQNLRCQVGQKDPFRQGLIRSGAYLQEIRQIFNDAGLPVDLAYLPHVESSFNPRAYSKFGAAGIWQFTRATGKRYMTVGYAVDERRDPILSSRAAARLHGINLKDLIAANNLDARATIHVDQNLKIPIAGEQAPVLAGVKPDQAEPKFVDHAEAPEQSMEPPATVAEMPEPEQRPILSAINPDTIEAERTFESERIQMTPKSSHPLKTATADQHEPEPVSIEPSLNPEIVQGNLAVRHIRTQNGRLIGIIRVEVEETLGHYAEWLEVSAGEIRRLNGFRYGEPIRINEAIKIPMSRVTKAEFEEKRYEYHKELAEDFFASYRVEKVQIYTIKRGDNIWTLSKVHFEVPLWLIKKFNAHLDFGALRPAQELKIPIIEKNQV